MQQNSMSHFCFLALLLVLYSSLNQATNEVYYITTDATDPCTAQPCLTLSQFAANSSHYLHSNTTVLVFLPGIHHLSKVNLTLSNVDNFIMQSGPSSTARIQCINDSHIQFNQSKFVNITNLEFIGCGGNRVKHVQKFTVEDTKFKGQGNSGTALELIETMAKIINGTFESNRKGSLRKYYVFTGGAIVATNSTVYISQSKFEDNGADNGGAISAEQHSSIIVTNNVFINNNASEGGGVLYSYDSSIIIEECEFHDNSAIDGGVLYSVSSTITIETTKFHNNSAIEYIGQGLGGVLYSQMSSIIIQRSEFHDNSAVDGGGVLYSQSSTITMEASKFHNNSVLEYTGRGKGGVLYSLYYNQITIQRSEFRDNSATEGGVLESMINIIVIESSKFYNNSATKGGVSFFIGDAITIETSEFNDNKATDYGGALVSTFASSITIGCSNFTRNVSPVGAVIHTSQNSKLQLFCGNNSFLVDDNRADRYAVIYLSNSQIIGHFIFSNNLGSLVAFSSNITFISYATFVNNHPSQTVSGDFQEGGAITLFQSNVFLYGVCNLEHNHAENGGAIYSTESKLYVNGDATIAHNTATGNGGGVYLSTSELNCQHGSIFVLFNNTAAHNGGGLHAISSSIRVTLTVLDLSNYHSPTYTGIKMNLTGNAAKRGGGLSMEASAKLYVLKYYNYFKFDGADRLDVNAMIFIGNSADYGGAVYVDDDTNPGICVSDPNKECFFQVLALYDENDPDLRTQSVYFSRNYATISGHTLYGGLLDRCAVSQFADIHNKYSDSEQYVGNGESYFKNISSGDITPISSLPVRVCLCTHQNQVEVKKGQTFTLSVVAVDQIGQPVSATIQTSLHFTESGLAEGQLARKIPAECTNLTFNVLSPHSSENLTLYALDGPCRDADLSTRTIEIQFLPCSCPIGLQVSGMNSTNCTCECHRNISRYMEHCNSHTGSFVKQPQIRAWISYINNTDLTGYLVYPNCPFDYCSSTSPPVDLNQPNGADTQYAFDRSSLMCGSCRPDLSLSLGSSRCLPCPSYWPALLIAITITAILAGIVLVALLLVLNVTIAVGSLNGLIFYVNVVYANKSILLPFQRMNFITVFISWLNLELGIDTCYFPGMDTYIKTWMQLAFPAYVILLVVLVIIISSYSTKFSNLIGKKDPVATLATLILLSFTRLLDTCFKSLSVGILEYPDGSSEMLWLPDAAVKYLSGKHVPLFIAAVLILLVGLVYTALLFSWKWILYLPRWRIFRWSRNPKIQTFIETYHKPYTPRHRYWTGLLLIVRMVLHIVATANISNNATIALSSIIFTICCIFALRLFFGSRLYRKWPADILETFFCLNILAFATFIWYSLDNLDSNQEAAAYTSVIITFIVLLFIILYHVYTYTSVFTMVKGTKPGRMIGRLIADTQPKPNLRRRHGLDPPPDNDIHRFAELLDVLDNPVNTKQFIKPIPVKPTFSIVEIHQSCDLTVPDHREAANTQHVPDAIEVI